MDSQEKMVALYCRYSGEEDNNGNGSNSINNQQLLLKSYALEHNLSPVRIYADDGFSGTKFERPDFQKMIHDIEIGTVGTVVVKDMSRFGRNHIIVGYYMEEFFLKHKVRFISVCDGVDTDVSTDELGPFRNIVNEMYARDISKKTRASVYARGKAGKKMISSPIYGYKNNENKEWIIDEPAAAIIRRIYNLYLSGNGLNAIAKLLTEEGIPKPSVYKSGTLKISGHSKYSDWTEQTIKFILKRQEYCGDTINFKTLRPSFKSNERIVRPKEENLIFSDTHPAIITREQFEDVQKMFEKRMRQNIKPKHKECIFHGLLRCNDCNCLLSGINKPRNYGIYTQYVCQTYRRFRANKHCTTHSVNEKYLIQSVCDLLKILIEMYNNGKLANWLKKNLDNGLIEEKSLAKKEYDEIKEKLDEAENILKSLYKDKVSGLLPNDVFLHMYNQFMNDKQALESRQYALSTTINTKDDTAVSINRFLKLIKKYAEEWDTTTIDRKMLLEFIDHIVVSDTFDEGAKQRHIDIYFNHVGLLLK